MARFDNMPPQAAVPRTDDLPTTEADVPTQATSLPDETPDFLPMIPAEQVPADLPDQSDDAHEMLDGLLDFF